MGFFGDNIEKPRLIIPYESYEKIMAYADLADGEISGFADVEWDNTLEALKIGEVYLLKQEAGGADVEMDADTIADFNLQMIKQGKNQLPRVWWHSHHTMGVFFSTTDEATIGELTNDTFMLAIVVNQAHELKTCLRICQPIPMIINDLPVTIDYSSRAIPESLRKEVKDKVKTRSFRNFVVKKDDDATSTNTWGDNETFKIQNFPKKVKEIKKIMKSHRLTMDWDYKRKEYVWIDKKANVKYIDIHESIKNPWGDEWDFSRVN